MSRKRLTSAQKAVRTRRRNAAKRAKKAAANLRVQAACRLTADGASSYPQMARRVQWLQQEWKLPAPPKIGRTHDPSAARLLLGPRRQSGLDPLRQSQGPAPHGAGAVRR
jgi:hypothetical protein